MGLRWWTATALLFVAALLQTSFLPALGLVSVRPDFVLQCIVIWAVLRGVRETLPWAFIGGLLLDLFSGGTFGTTALVLVLVAFCSSVGEISLLKSNALIPIVMVFWASVLDGLLTLFFLASQHYHLDWPATIRQVVVPNALLNTACAPLTYWFLSRIERRARQRLELA